ncbi:Actin, aortic smooth muscle [Lemmus lemmus]
MITEPPLNSTAVKCRMTQILFETFNVPALYMANQGVLSMYAAGRTSGTTIESGEGMTYFVPVINGYPLQLSTTKLDIAGQDLTMYLLKLLSDSGNLLVSTGRKQLLSDA